MRAGMSKPRHQPDPAAWEALQTLHRQMTRFVAAGTERELNARHLAVMLHLYLHPSDPLAHTVRGLSSDLGIPRPAICRAADHLSAHGLAGRNPDPEDGRSVLIALTKKGAALLDALAGA